MLLSFAIVAVHSLVTPTMTIWASSECMRGCQSLLSNIASYFRGPCCAGEATHQDSLSCNRRELALDQAKRASAWRREQSCDRRSRSTAIRLTDTAVTKLTNDLGERRHVRPGNPTSNGSLPSITVVKPLTSKLTSSPRLSESVSCLTLSEISCQFSNIQLSKHIVDPVNHIACFKTSKFDERESCI